MAWVLISELKLGNCLRLWLRLRLRSWQQDFGFWILGLNECWAVKAGNERRRANSGSNRGFWVLKECDEAVRECSASSCREQKKKKVLVSRRRALHLQMAESGEDGWQSGTAVVRGADEDAEEIGSTVELVQGRTCLCSRVA